MATFPTNVNLNDTNPPPKPDAFNVEWQAGAPYPDPNVTGAVVRDSSAFYRTPQVGGVVVLTEVYDLGGPDSGWTFVCNSATPFTITHPAGIPQLPNPQGLWNFTIINLGAGTVTLDLNGLNLDGSGTNPTYATGEGAEISTDGTDLYTCLSSGAGGATWGSITGTLSSQTDLQSALNLKAPLASPALTGAPTAPTASPGTNTTQVATTAFVQAAIPATALVIGFIINNGAAGTNVGPELLARAAGTVTKCVIVTKTSDGTTGLTFKIKKNGTDVFSVDPSVAAATSGGTVSSTTSLTSNPLSVAANDVFTIDITSGTPNWAFTAQLET